MSTPKPPRKGKKRKKKSRNGTVAAPPVTPTMVIQRSWWIAAVIAVLLGGHTLWAWNPRPAPEPHVERGNHLFEQRQYRDALGEYEGAPGGGPRNAGVHMDRGLAQYRTTVPPSDAGVLSMMEADAAPPDGFANAQEELRTAARGGSTGAAEDVDAFLRARAAYNLANTFFSQHHWDNAIDAFKEALRLRPSWHDAAWNLELARRLRDEENQPPDAGPDAAQDASQDADHDSGDSSQDSGGGDSGSSGDSGSNGDSGSSGDSGAQPPDAGNQDQPDAGAQPQQPDGSAPRSMSPLDDLDRTSRSLQDEMMRRRGLAPRSPDEDR